MAAGKAVGECLKKFLDSYPGIFEVLDDRKKIFCKLTKHEIPLCIDAVKNYVKGKKFMRLHKKMKSSDSSDIFTKVDDARDFFAPSKRGKSRLYCTLTKKEINNVPHEIEKYVTGYKFMKAKFKKKEAAEDGGKEEIKLKKEEEMSDDNEQDDIPNFAISSDEEEEKEESMLQDDSTDNDTEKEQKTESHNVIEQDEVVPSDDENVDRKVDVKEKSTRDTTLKTNKSSNKRKKTELPLENISDIKQKKSRKNNKNVKARGVK